jgi:hypothetical protein
MVYTCLRCGEHRELRRGKRTGNSLLEYERMRQELRNSFLKSDAELCPDCLEKLLKDFVRTRIDTEQFVRRAGYKIRARF